MLSRLFWCACCSLHYFFFPYQALLLLAINVVACFQVIIIPIWKKTDEKTGVLAAALSVKESLQSAGIRVKIDDSDQKTPGWKFNFWEMKVCYLSNDHIPLFVTSGILHNIATFYLKFHYIEHQSRLLR